MMTVVTLSCERCMESANIYLPMASCCSQVEGELSCGCVCVCVYDEQRKGGEGGGK